MKKLIIILMAAIAIFSAPEVKAQTAYTTTKVSGDISARMKRDTLTNTDTLTYELEVATASDALTWTFAANRTSGTANGVIHLYAKTHPDEEYTLISTDTLTNTASQQFRRVLQRNDYKYWKVWVPQGSTAVVRYDIYLLNRQDR